MRAGIWLVSEVTPPLAERCGLRPVRKFRACLFPAAEAPPPERNWKDLVNNDLNLEYGIHHIRPKSSRLGWVTGVVLSALLVFSFLSGVPASEVSRLPDTTENQRIALSLLRETVALVEENYFSTPDMKVAYGAGLRGLQGTFGKDRLDLTRRDARHFTLRAGKKELEVYFGGGDMDGLASMEEAYRFALANLEPKDKEDGELKVMYGMLRSMMSSLDTFSSFLPPDVFREMQVETSGHYGGIGVTITTRDKRVYIVSPFDDSPADKVGLKTGDEIVAVEGDSIAGKSLTEAVSRMRGVPGTPVRISILREGWSLPREFVLVRAVVQIKSVKAKVLDGNIGYLRLTAFHERTTDELDKAMDRLIDAGVRGLILDLRNNPGGLLHQSVRVAERFLPNRSMVVFTRGRHRSQTMYFRTHVNGIWVKKPLIVLVNRGSASASEIVAGALQDLDRALIIGARTYGKGSVQTIIPLAEGAGVRITTAKYYTPLGIEIHGKGIRVDVEVKDPSGDKADNSAESGKSGVKKRPIRPRAFASQDGDLVLKVAVETLKRSKSSAVEVLRYNAFRVKTSLLDARKTVSRARIIPMEQ